MKIYPKINSYWAFLMCHFSSLNSDKNVDHCKSVNDKWKSSFALFVKSSLVIFYWNQSIWETTFWYLNCLKCTLLSKQFKWFQIAICNLENSDFSRLLQITPFFNGMQMTGYLFPRYSTELTGGQSHRQVWQSVNSFIYQILKDVSHCEYVFLLLAPYST